MIYTIAVCLWAAIAVTLYFIEYARLHLLLRIKKPGKRPLIGTIAGTDSRYWYPFNRKPFNCEVCLPFWLNAVFLPIAMYIPNGVQILVITASLCTSGIITGFLIKLIKK